MSEIQETIDWFRRRKDMGLSDKCQNAENTALNALQAQAEREKGCEMCKSDVPMIFDTFTGMDGKPVNFCPNCGRDLRKPVSE